MENYFKNCIQEFQLNIINQTKAQISEVKAEIKEILFGSYPKGKNRETEDKPIGETTE